MPMRSYRDLWEWYNSDPSDITKSEKPMEEINPTPRAVTNLSLDDIIREYAFWNQRIREAYVEVNAYKAALIEYAHAARSGQNTVHLETADGAQSVKVEFKKKYQCDQMSIECARGLLMTAEEEANLPAEKAFRDLFKIEYTPKSRNYKTFLNTLSGNERTAVAKEMLKDAIVEVDAQPYLTVEKDKNANS